MRTANDARYALESYLCHGRETLESTVFGAMADLGWTHAEVDLAIDSLLDEGAVRPTVIQCGSLGWRAGLVSVSRLTWK